MFFSAISIVVNAEELSRDLKANSPCTKEGFVLSVAMQFAFTDASIPKTFSVTTSDGIEVFLERVALRKDREGDYALDLKYAGYKDMRVWWHCPACYNKAKPIFTAYSC